MDVVRVIDNLNANHNTDYSLTSQQVNRLPNPEPSRKKVTQDNEFLMIINGNF